MLRGRLILKNADPVETANECLKANVEVRVRGRSTELLKKRNRVILYRYYLYKNFAKWPYQTIIETVSEEMYLSPATVTGILTSQVADLKQIYAEQPPLMRLSKSFPHYNWSISAVASK